MTHKIAVHKSRRTRNSQSIHTRSHLVECSKDFSLKQHPNANEITMFRELFYALILKAELGERKIISQYLSRIPHTPRPIAIYFGLDDIDIAAPMLLFSPVFEALDLKRIIAKQGIKHLGVIARRNDLESQTIHDLLLKDDNENTLRNLIKRNPSINKGDEVTALLNKSTQELRDELEVAELSQPDARPAPPQELKTKDLSNDLLALARKDAPYRSNEQKSRKALSPGAKLGERMLGYAREHDKEGLMLLIHKTCLLEWERIGSLLRTDNTGLQTTLLRALDIPVKEASQLMLLINSNVGRNADVFKLIMLKYQNLGVLECRKLYEKQGAVFGELQPTEVAPDKSRKHFSSLLTQRRNSILSAKVTKQDQKDQAQIRKRA